MIHPYIAAEDETECATCFAAIYLVRQWRTWHRQTEHERRINELNALDEPMRRRHG